MFENMDPDAQALYLALREMFPGVTHYGAEPGMGPAGFQAVHIWQECWCATGMPHPSAMLLTVIWRREDAVMCPNVFSRLVRPRH